MAKSTGIEGFEIRFALKSDCELILEFIKGLAQYEKLEHEVTATKDDIAESIFVREEAEVLIGEYKGQPVAFALFFKNYSTFLGQANMYLEDLFVKEEYRGKGFGEAMLRRLCQIAVERNLKRLDWWCLNWNESSVEFYHKMGATAMDEWTVFRLSGDALKQAAERR